MQNSGLHRPATSATSTEVSMHAAILPRTNGFRFFVDRARRLLTESAGIANAPMTKLLLRTCPFEGMSATSDAITEDENGIHNTGSKQRGTLALYNVQSNDGIDRDSDAKNANYCRDENETYKNDSCVIEELPLQPIAKNT